MFYNSSNSRRCTNAILELIDEGLLDMETVLTACLNALSERDVQEMAQSNEFCERCPDCGDFGIKDDNGTMTPCGHGDEEEQDEE